MSFITRERSWLSASLCLAFLTAASVGCGEDSDQNPVVENDPQPARASLSFVGFGLDSSPVLRSGKSTLMGGRRVGSETAVKFLVNNPTDAPLILSFRDSGIPEFDLRTWDGERYIESGNLMGCGLRVVQEVVVAPGEKLPIEVPLQRTEFISQIALFFYLNKPDRGESYVAWSDKFVWPPVKNPPKILLEYLGPAVRDHPASGSGLILSARRFWDRPANSVIRIVNPTEREVLFECRGAEHRPSLAFRSWVDDKLTEYRWDFSYGDDIEHCNLAPGGEWVFDVELSQEPSLHQIGVRFQLAGDANSFWLWTEKFSLPSE